MSQQTHEALHSRETTASLPEADAILSKSYGFNRSNTYSRRSVARSGQIIRRDPYGSSTAEFGINQDDNDPVSRSSDDKVSRLIAPGDNKRLSASIKEDGTTEKIGQTAAYSSYRYGTKSISRSRQNASLDKSSQYGSRQHKTIYGSNQIDLPPDASLIQTFLSNLFRRGQVFVDDLNGSSELSIRYQQLMVLIPFLVIIIISLPTILGHFTTSGAWEWSPGRSLDDRQCVMNLFIEKQPIDEYNPDFVEPSNEDKLKAKKTGKPFVQPTPIKEEGTYRTKGQMKVVTRLIESVADSFRSNTTVQQHLVFAGTRDGGHLAEVALKHWPLRGTFRTQLHVFAAEHNKRGEETQSKADKSDDEMIKSEDPLDYGYLEAIEERFKAMDQVRVFDRHGVAGNGGTNDDTDDELEEFPWRSRRKLQVLEDDDDDADMNIEPLIPSFPLEEMLRTHAEGDEEDEIGIIPYMHIDGESMESQMEILRSARKLFEDEAVVVAGIEHSADMNVYELIDHFNSVNYKTFFLGSRQIARIDNLCPEILKDIIKHPSIAKEKLSKFGKWLKTLGFPIGGDDTESDTKNNPPFFVAMPRGRLNREEMTIQHMYDLFGGYGGGGGQIKTANDRKAPGKK